MKKKFVVIFWARVLSVTKKFLHMVKKNKNKIMAIG